MDLNELQVQQVETIKEFLLKRLSVETKKDSNGEIIEKQETLEINSCLYPQTNKKCRKITLPETRGDFTGVKKFGAYVNEIKTFASYGKIIFNIENEHKEIEIKTDYGQLTDADLINLGMLSLLDNKLVKVAVIKEYRVMDNYVEIRRYKVIELELY